MSKALLILDMQEVTVGKNHAEMFKYPADMIQRVNSVIEDNSESIIVYI